MGWQLISETEPKAKKEHECVWCGETIKVGERYTRITGTYYGDFDSQAWHPECSDASKKHFSENDEEEFTPGDYVRGSTQCKWETVCGE